MANPSYGDPSNTLLRKIAEGVAGGGVSPSVQSALDAKEDKANKSTDGTFAANSDTLYPSQKAAKTYSDASKSAAVITSKAYTDSQVSNHSILTYSTTPIIDFAGDPYKTITMTGDATFSTANRVAAKSVTVRIIAGASPRNLTFNAGWIFVGGAAPASLAANKEAILTVTVFGSAESDVRAAYAAQP